MTMNATIIGINPRGFLVRSEIDGQEIQVNYRNPNRFSVGDRIRITFSGQMTQSIPPQISATSIQLLQALPTPPPPPTSSELRGVVLRIGRNYLMVRNNENRQVFRVEYPNTRHFCVGRQVVVRYEKIFLSVPPMPSRVIANEIISIC